MKSKTLIITVLFATLSMYMMAQEAEKEKEIDKNVEGKANLDLTVDLMSRYVWRGLDYGNSPNIQPCLAFTKGGLEVGAWGAYDIHGNYAEADLYASFTIKGISLLVTDFFLPDETAGKNKYFNWENESTGHGVEVGMGYEGPEKLPITFFAGVVVYGADKYSKNQKQNNYSTYIELGYAGKIAETEYSIFIGGTTYEGWYGSELGVVNLGLTASNEVKITDHFSLPTSFSLITNPQKENVYFVFGFSF